MKIASAFRITRCSPDIHLFVARRSVLTSARAMASAPPPAAVRLEVQDRIELTEAEAALFDTLLAAAKHAGTGTVLRCAGGWVRDKLLGRQSPDIDVALDNMLGREFAEKVRCKKLYRVSSACIRRVILLARNIVRKGP